MPFGLPMMTPEQLSVFGLSYMTCVLPHALPAATIEPANSSPFRVSAMLEIQRTRESASLNHSEWAAVSRYVLYHALRAGFSGCKSSLVSESGLIIRRAAAPAPIHALELPALAVGETVILMTLSPHHY